MLINKIRIILLIIVIFLIMSSSVIFANVFAHNVRITQPHSSTLAFDGNFTDGSGALIRFTLSDYADTVNIKIYNSAMNMVRSFHVENLSMGENAIEWEGMNDDSLMVGIGSYSLQIYTSSMGFDHYTVLKDYEAGIFTRGVTSVRTQSVKNFGFTYSASLGGYAIGVTRHSNDLAEYGDVPGDATLSVSYRDDFSTVGSDNLRYSSEADDDGYVYLARRSSTVPAIYRYHVDTLSVELVDSNGYGEGVAPQGIAIAGTGSTQLIIVSDWYGKVHSFLNDGTTTAHTKELLIDDPNAVFWDVTTGDKEGWLYATYQAPDTSFLPGVAAFDFSAWIPGSGPLTLADAAWTVEAPDTATAGTITYSEFDNQLYCTFARRPHAPLVQGIYTISDLDGTPTMNLVYLDPEDNMTQFRADVAIDAAGNIIFFENSNEFITLISPPSGFNSYLYVDNFTTIDVTLSAESIAEIRIDSNLDFIPDRLDETVTISGIVLNESFSASSTEIFIQDISGGIQLWSSAQLNENIKVADEIIVTGTIAQYQGKDELAVVNMVSDVTIISANNIIVPIQLSIEELLLNAELYEGRLIKINNVTKTAISNDWPLSGNDQNLTITDPSGLELTLRIDKETNLDENVEPIWPINIIGILSQFSSNEIPNDGYQILPRYYSDIEQGVIPQEINVTFQVDMSHLANLSLFDPFADTVKCAGSFSGWLGDAKIMADINGDSIYTSKISLAPDSAYDYKFIYSKFAGNGATWESGTNRTIVTNVSDTILSVEQFRSEELDTEREALVALYNSTNGANWTNNTNWLTTAPLEDWFGITVLNGHVNVVELNYNNLIGLIPTEIGSLTLLSVLILSDNQLTGPIPTEIGSLTSLTYLSLVSNQLTGPIPTEIGSLTSLTYLGLMGNQLTETIPTEIGSLTSLTSLSLGGNQLTGTIPTEIGSLTLLTGLYLWGNQLTGTIPTEIGRLTSLRHLALSGNQLTGTIPVEINNLDSLHLILLDNNSFNELPNLTLVSLEQLHIHENNFSFEDIIPNIGVASNSFTYSPQDSIGILKTLTQSIGSLFNTSVTVGGEGNQYQWKKDNVIVNGANDSLFSITSITQADIGSYICEITNPSAPDLTLYSRPVTLSIDGVVQDLEREALIALYNSTNGANWDNNINWLTDAPLDEWYGVTVVDGHVTKLFFLSNGLYGNIPPQIGDLKYLSELNLRENRLQGSIPPEIGQLSSLGSLDLSGNSLNGTVPVEIRNLVYLRNFYIFDNSFDELPELSSLTNLYNLDVRYNKFTFEDILPNIGIASNSFNYYSQANVGQVIDTTVNEGNSFSISLIVGGEGNKYQWKKDDLNINGATQNSFLINSTSLSDQGSYTCEITNPGAPILILSSEPINLIVEANIVTEISVSSPTINFGYVENNKSKAESFTITNTGSSDLVVSSISINNNHFTLDPIDVSNGFTLSPNNSRSIRVLFQPTGYLDYSASISIKHNAVNGESIINAVNGETIINASGKGFYYPENITVVNSYPFNGDKNQSSYRMFSVPGSQATSISSCMTGDPGQKKDWIAYDYNGGFVEYDKSAPWSFTPGKAYWILSTSSFNLQSSGRPSVSLDGDNCYSIPLKIGWNLISNPFLQKVEWSDVKVTNAISGDITDYSGSDIAATEMEPYKGYWYYNVNGSALKIPFITNISNAEALSKTTNLNSLELYLSSNDEIKSKISIGLNEEAAQGYDHFDKYSPPSFMNQIKMLVLNDNLETEYKFLKSDFRDMIGEGQVYDIQIKNESSTAITLLHKNIDVFEGYEVFLIDSYLKSYNLKESNNIYVPGNSSNLFYKLVIGDKEFVKTQEDLLLPENFILRQNYPNPFNPETTISYLIPNVLEKVNVTLIVYDLMGQEVAKLVNNTQTPGRYEVNFNASKLTSGVYYYRLQSGEFTETKKMILLK